MKFMKLLVTSVLALCLGGAVNGIRLGEPKNAIALDSVTKTSLRDLPATATSLNGLVAQTKLYESLPPFFLKGVSRLQLDEGMFRMIQGSSYRVFRPSYAFNHDSTKDYDLPYVLEGFLELVDWSSRLYASVPGAGPGRPRPAAWTELYSALKKEYDRALAAGPPSPDAPSIDRSSPAAFLDYEQEVYLKHDSNGKLVTGTIRIGFWYEVFMPLLLRACSPAIVNPMPSEADLDAWFKKNNDEGRFKNFGGDVVAAWPGANYSIKLNLRMAWRLAETYLNGPAKQRETDPDRVTGDLSNYVVFMDIYSNNTHIRDAKMRVTYGWFWGTSTWRLLHSLAELIDLSGSNASLLWHLDLFKGFFQTLPKTLACPYCRKHFITQVSVNNPEEQPLYPIEWIFTGWNPKLQNSSADGFLTIQDRLFTIQNGGDLRLFLWKMHNAVQSSIERDYSWYRLNPTPLYTTRWWPSLEGETWLSNFVGDGALSAKLVQIYLDLTELGVSLNKLRPKVLSLDKASQAERDLTTDQAQTRISTLEDRLTRSQALQAEYFFNVAISDEDTVASAMAALEIFGNNTDQIRENQYIFPY